MDRHLMITGGASADNEVVSRETMVTQETGAVSIHIGHSRESDGTQ